MNVRNTTIVFMLCLPYCALAQQGEHSPAQEEARGMPEEITVTGERSLPQLRLQMMDAEKRAYDVFNKFNDEKRFNISCSMHQPTGTRFESQVCQPEFQIQATRAHGQAFLETYRTFLEPFQGGPVTDGSSSASMSVGGAIASQLPDYQRKIRQVAEEHPEFLEAVIQYSGMRERYEAATRTGE